MALSTKSELLNSKEKSKSKPHKSNNQLTRTQILLMTGQGHSEWSSSLFVLAGFISRMKSLVTGGPCSIFLVFCLVRRYGTKRQQQIRDYLSTKRAWPYGLSKTICAFHWERTVQRHKEWRRRFLASLLKVWCDHESNTHSAFLLLEIMLLYNNTVTGVPMVRFRYYKKWRSCGYSLELRCRKERFALSQWQIYL